MWLAWLTVTLAAEPCELLDVPFIHGAPDRRFKLTSTAGALQLQYGGREPARVDTLTCTKRGRGLRCGDVELRPADGCQVEVTEAGAPIGAFTRDRGVYLWEACADPGAGLVGTSAEPLPFGGRAALRYTGTAAPKAGCTATFDVYADGRRVAEHIPEPAGGLSGFEVSVASSGPALHQIVRWQTCAGAPPERLDAACAVVEVTPPPPGLYGVNRSVYVDGVAYPSPSKPGDPVILGALDRAAIDEVVARQMNQIRYCYQRVLVDQPTLQGKIVVKFTIAGNGEVSAAAIKETSMNNEAVEQCIVGRFLRMTFPPARGGGIVIVSYPFVFTPK